MTEWYRDPETIRVLYGLTISNGIVKKLSSGVAESSVAGTIGVLVTPSLYPLDQFTLARDVQPGFNSLIDSVSRSHEFLTSALENVLETDSFTSRLFEIYEKTRQDNQQTCSLGIHRCDYMLDWRGDDGGMGLRQIEINTVACSIQGFAPGLKSFHEYVCSRYAENETFNVPQNLCLEATVDAIAIAWNEFENEEAVVLFVVEEETLNMYDQLAIEVNLWKRHSIKCLRKTLSRVHGEARLGPDRQLILLDVVCAVVYFRAGYSPRHYPTEKEWEARLLLERSTASLSPGVAYQLVGTKKVQQCLASPGALEQFVSDPKLVKKMRSTFAGLYALDKTPEGDRAVELALQDPDRFVLKPQREGGGKRKRYKEEWEGGERRTG
jgi:glutathione synthetase